MSLISISILKYFWSFKAYFFLWWNFVDKIFVQVVIMSQQWRTNNQTIRDNLEDDDEEKYMMNQLVYMNHIDSFDDEHIQTRGSQPNRKPNKDRLALFHSKLFYNDYFSKTPVFNVVFFCEVYRMRKCLFFASVQFYLWEWWLFWAENKLRRCYWFVCFVNNTSKGVRKIL